MIQISPETVGKSAPRRTPLALTLLALLSLAPTFAPGVAAQGIEGDLTVGLDVPGAFSNPAAGATISLTDVNVNVSANPVGPSTTKLYMSTSSTFDGSAILLASRDVPALGPGGRNSGSSTFTLPAGHAGLRHLFAVADADNAVAEGNEGNNVSPAKTILVGADLIVWIDVPGSVATVLPGGTVTVSDWTRSDNSASAGASTTRFYLVPGTSLDLATAIPIGSREVPALGPSTTNTGPTTLTIPADAAGTFRIIAKADADDAVLEANEGNNVSGASLAFALGPDLIVALDLPGSAAAVAAGATVSLTDITRNRGRVPVGASTTTFFLSQDAIFDASDVPLGSRPVPGLAANVAGTSDESTGTTPVTLPGGIAGLYRVIAVADADNARPESNEANNVAVSSLIAIGPDLIVSGTTVPTRAVAGATISLSDATKNRGAGAADPTGTSYYLSRDPVLDAADVFLGTRAIPALGPGNHNLDSTTVVIPGATAPGCYFLIALADAAQASAESDEGNNALAKAIQISATPTVRPACASRDFNGDGKSDILWRHASGHTNIWLMDGATMLSETIPASPDPAWQIDGTGDVDGDGEVDILWRETTSGAVGIWLMDGVNLASGTIMAVTPPLAWQIHGVGDFNRDGKADILWRETTSGAVAIWLMDGVNLVTGTVVPITPSLAWQIHGVGDFNGDGKVDVLWRETVSGAVAIWLMDGVNLVTGTAVATTPSLAWQIHGVGDFNGDGKADILWRETTSGAVGIWLMDGVNLVNGAAVAVTPSLAWQIHGVGDFNGDRRADILWRDATGLVGVWLMDGTSMLSGDISGPGAPDPVDLDWTIE